MNSSSQMTLHLEPCTHMIYRPFGGLDSFRLISDPAGRLAVTTFPMEVARRLAASFDQWSACYVLAGRGQAYIAQSHCAMKCIAEHALDPAKAFATDAYLIHSQRELDTMDWSIRLYLEHRLSELTTEAKFVRLVNPIEPRVLPWRLEQAATLENVVAQARRLLFDGGCRVLDGNLPGPPAAQVKEGESADADEAGEFACSRGPAKEEFEFDYCGIRARGHSDLNGFVVMAGSEARSVLKPSLRQNIKMLRADLLASGVVVPIPRAKDRLRFQVDWCFFSPAVAAKFVAGAHVAGTKWVRHRSSPPIGSRTR